MKNFPNSVITKKNPVKAVDNFRHLSMQRKILPKITIIFSFALLTILFTPMIGAAQATDSTLESASLDNVVAYALENQPAVKQAQLDEEITKRVIRGKLADWYPQVDFGYNYQRNFDL